MKSCIYKGQVKHRRFTPRRHEFRYSLFLMYVDLDELPTLFDRFLLWSSRGFNLARFRRSDHHGDPAIPLSDSIRKAVLEETGTKPEGPIRLLTHFRYFGFGFNPVSFYYCFDASGDRVETIVCEVNNTPWGEQHLYVLPEAGNQGSVRRKVFARSKEFHVSPFMPMDMEYEWRFSEPGEHLGVYMLNFRNGDKVFDASLALSRTPINAAQLALALVQFPLMTIKVVGGIYFEALRLWLKKIPFHPHPEHKEAPARVTRA